MDMAGGDDVAPFPTILSRRGEQSGGPLLSAAHINRLNKINPMGGDQHMRMVERCRLSTGRRPEEIAQRNQNRVAFRIRSAPTGGMWTTPTERGPPGERHRAHAPEDDHTDRQERAAPVFQFLGSALGGQDRDCRRGPLTWPFESGCRDSNPGPLDPQLPPNHPATSQHVSREIRDQDFRERPKAVVSSRLTTFLR